MVTGAASILELLFSKAAMYILEHVSYEAINQNQ